MITLSNQSLLAEDSLNSPSYTEELSKWKKKMVSTFGEPDITGAVQGMCFCGCRQTSHIYSGTNL